MKSNKGITLAALVVTIIVTLILAGTATYVGYDAIQTSTEQRFLSQLKEVNEAINLHTEDYIDLGLVQLETEVTFNDNSYNYKLESKEDYDKIGLSNIEDTIYVNFDTGQIYSENGINGKHTLKDFGVEYYKPTQESITEQNNIFFDINLEPQQYSWKYIVNDSSIICDGNVQEGNLFYSEYIDGTNHYWKRVERTSDGFSLEIKQPGIYELKFRDLSGNESDVKQVYAYVKDGLQLYYDGEYNENYKHNSETTTWTDLSGNNRNTAVEGPVWDTNKLTFDTDNKITVPIDEQPTDDITIELTFENNESVSTFFRAVTDWKTFNFHSWTDGTIYIGGNYASGDNSARMLPEDMNNQIIEQNKIYNVIYTYDGDSKNANLYLNGKKIASKTYNISPENSDNFEIPASGSKKIYKLSFYKRVLSESEAVDNYNVDKIRYNISE